MRKSMRDEGMSTGSDQSFEIDSPDEILEKFQTLSSTLRSSSYEPSSILSERIRTYLKDELPQNIDRGVEKLNEKESSFEKLPLLESARNYLEDNEWNFEVLLDHSTHSSWFRRSKW